MGEMKERMLCGELYIGGDPEVAADDARAQELVERYNRTLHREQAERDEILRELIGDLGEGVVIRRPSAASTAPVSRSAPARSSTSIA